MYVTRRIFTTGLAAMLSVICIPGVSASEKVDTPKVIVPYDYVPFIEYLEVGEREEMLNGPATAAGWYLHPSCMMGCCNSDGPFQSREAALNRLEEILKSA